MKTADEMRTIATRVQEYFLNGKTDAALYKMLEPSYADILSASSFTNCENENGLCDARRDVRSR